jgi:hypothetical protein
MSTTRRFRSFGWLSTLVCVIAACGGNVLVDESTGGSGATGGSAPSACPASVPASGAPCNGGVECSFELANCHQSATCVSGQWVTGPLVCPTCPATAPSFGEPCGAEGAVCDYPDPSCSGAGAQATCKGGLWNVVYFGTGCAAACPVDPPVNGAPCNGCCEDVCSYLPIPGCAPVVATCEGDAWSMSGGGCAPPPPTCLQHGNPVACANDVSCRWLVPGCSPNALPFEGCFAKTECTSDSECGPGQLCWKGDYDPCWNKACDTCSATTFVCLPPPPP